jgi:alpha-2-macroglobulin
MNTSPGPIVCCRRIPHLWILVFLCPLYLCAQASELRIISVSPQGLTKSIDQSFRIVVVFSEPMTALTIAEEHKTTGPLAIEPFIAGTYSWLGTSTLAFTPTDTLPLATHFTASIPAGTHSLAGSVLTAAYSWSFETLRPSIFQTFPTANDSRLARFLRNAPPNNEQRMERDRPIMIVFNQRVDPSIARKWISVQEDSAGVISYPVFTTRRPSDEELSGVPPSISRYDMEQIAHERDRVLVVVPVKPFHKGSTIRVNCKEGLQVQEGTLGTIGDYHALFSVYGDLKFEGVRSDGNFHPDDPIILSFSNPVLYSELSRHLTIEGEPVNSPRESADEYAYDSQSVRLTLKPNTQYTGVITSGLTDVFGYTLEEETRFTFRTSTYPASISMTTGASVLEANDAHSFPVTIVNVDSVEVSMGKLSPEQIVPLNLTMLFREYEYFDIGREWTSTVLRGISNETGVKRIWELHAPLDTAVIRRLSLDEILGVQKKGIAYLQLKRFDTQVSPVLKSIVQVTNIGLTVKYSPDSILIFTTHLNDVSPVSNAIVELRTDSNRVVWRGRTNAAGIANAPGWGMLDVEPQMRYYDEQKEYGTVIPPTLWVIVQKDSDCAYASVRSMPGYNSRSSDHVDIDRNPDREVYEGVTFTDRGLYKGGETVNVKAIVRVRKNGAWQGVGEGVARVLIRDPRNEEIDKQEVPLNKFGSLSLVIPLKASAPTGRYWISVFIRSKSKKVWMETSTGSFRVEAFRLAEFEVKSAFDSGSYMIGDTIRGSLHAQYLFGAPIKNALMSWRMYLSPLTFSPKGYDGFSFGTVNWSSVPRRLSKRLPGGGNAALDDSGSLAVSAFVNPTEYKGTYTVTLEGYGRSASNQYLSGRAATVVHGGEYYVGVKPNTTLLAADSALIFSLATVTQDAVPVPGRRVAVTIYRREWHTVYRPHAHPYLVWQSEPVDSLVDSFVVQSSTHPSVHRFLPMTAGFYFLTALSIDERGDSIETQLPLYASGRGYTSWEHRYDNRIDLVADRSNYAPGDVAEIFIKSPYQHATALISIEREGVLSHYTTELEGTAPRITIPIEHAYLPNVFVTVVLLHGGGDSLSEGQNTQSRRPAFNVGCVKLSVSPKEQLLHVNIETRTKEYHPGDTVSAVVTVRDARGAGVKSELTVSVADQGVLNLIEYHLPDPFTTFYRERGLGVATSDSREHLVGVIGFGETRMANTAAQIESDLKISDDGLVRKNFAASAYWNPFLLTDDSGRVTFRFKLPDNVSGFTLMAVAQSLASQFGEGETTIRVSKPILLLPSVPRLARTGDLFDAGVVVINHTQQSRTVALTAAATGVVMEAKNVESIQLAPGQAREVTYRFNAESIGTAVLTFAAKSGGDEDGLQCSFPIVSPRRGETTALMNSTTEPTSNEAINIPVSIMPDEGSVEVTAASTAMVGLSGGMSYLFTYPYGCLEQRASSVLPILLAGDLVDAFKFDVFKNQDYKLIAQKTIDEIPRYQDYDGGFSYWKGDRPSSPFISAYAVYTLLEAQEHGYRVETRAYENGIQYLSRLLAGGDKDPRESIEAQNCTRAFILYTLARAGKLNAPAMDKLYSERTSLPLFAKAYLLRAYALKDAHSPMANELARDLVNCVKIDPTGASFEEPVENGLAEIFHSNVRTTAIILQALIEADKDAELGAKIVRRLMNVQHNGRWRSTQENLYVVSALASYFKKYEREEPQYHAQIALDGKKLLAELFAGRSLETFSERENISALPKGRDIKISISKEGDGRLYYGVRMNYTPKGDTPPLNEGITVQKTIEPYEVGSGPDIRTGMLMKITVNVVADQDRHFVAVDDPVPAGFEVVSMTFATSASNVNEAARSSYVFNHTETYDDRVSLFAVYLPAGMHTYSYLVRAIHAGTYVMPSTRAECMYEPEVFGCTQSGRIQIH